MKYYNKTILFEAFQWHGEQVQGFDRIAVGRDELSNQHYNLVIPTLEGTIYAAEGDWIITNIKGEHSICDPGIFGLIYEPEI